MRSGGAGLGPAQAAQAEAAILTLTLTLTLTLALTPTLSLAPTPNPSQAEAAILQRLQQLQTQLDALQTGGAQSAGQHAGAQPVAQSGAQAAN